MNRRQFMQTASILAGSSLITSFPARLIAQEKITFKYDCYVPQTAGPARLDEWFLSELERRTNGTVDVRRYWAQSLSKVGEHLSAVRDGISETSLISPGYYQAELPATRGLEWYYRMDRADNLLKVCRDVYKDFEPLRQEWENRHRSHVLYWTNWYYAPLVTRVPIKSLDDIRGMKIRAYGSASTVIENLGGTAIPMAAPEVYTALERGVLDGVYGFDFITAMAYRLHEIAPYFTDIGDGPHAPAATIMNIDFWNSLPADVKEVCNELAEEIYQGKYAEIYEAAARDYVRIALDEGANFTALPEEAMLKAKELVQPEQVNNWVTEVAEPNGIDGMEMQKIIEKYIAKHAGTGSLKRPVELAREM